NKRLVNRSVDTAEVVAINQVSVPILAEGKDKLRRRSSIHIDNRRADAAQVGIRAVEREPVVRRPVVGRLTRPRRSTLQTDNRFSAHPNAACAKSVTSNHEQISAIARYTAMAPNSAASRSRCGPRLHVWRIVDIQTDNPAVVIVA